MSAQLKSIYMQYTLLIHTIKYSFGLIISTQYYKLKLHTRQSPDNGSKSYEKNIQEDICKRSIAPSSFHAHVSKSWVQEKNLPSLFLANIVALFEIQLCCLCEWMRVQMLRTETLIHKFCKTKWLSSLFSSLWNFYA